tara:strand:+ start:145 stop:441 length:297 start_codon:yes stop_codon:yes gene_type:complete
MGDSISKFEELIKNENKGLKNVLENYLDENSKEILKQLESPEHYSNEKGSLYKIGLERGWNPYQFDAIKRIDRAYKKGQFKEDIEKTELVLKLMLNNK